jgi:hypothetical protein
MKSTFLLCILCCIQVISKAQTPIASYPFTGNANDAIGVNHGTVNGATLTTDRFGNANSAYSFDGVNDKITAPIATNVTSNYSLSGWVKLNSNNTAQVLFYNGNTSADGWGLYLSATGVLNILHGSLVMQPTTAVLSTNQWYHLALVNETGVTKAYVNGALVYTGILTTPLTPSSSFFMSSNTINTEYVNGVLDDIKIYSTALTAAQILADYTPGLEVIASYSFSNNVSDSSGNNLHGTIIGSPSFVADRNGIPNKAIAFNGNVANRVEVNDNAFLHTSSISIAAWVKFNSLAGSHQGVVDKPLGTGFADSWHFGTQGGNWSTWIMNNTSTNPFSQLTSPITTGQWYFVVSTFDNATKEHRLYIDGTLKSSTTFNSTIGYDNSKMYFGAAIENNVLDYPMNGAIDEVKIYNTALTANQVFSEYSSLMASYPFTGNADDAIGTNHGTVNGATLTMDRFENPNSAYSFDGVNDFIQMSSPSYTAYTIEAYMRFDGPTADRNVVVFTQGNPFVSASHQIRTDASGHFVHYTFDGTGHAVVSNTIAQLNVDYHVTIVASNNGQMKLYINGIEEGTPINIGTLWNAGTEFRVGTGTVGIIGLNNANYFNGSIDDIKIYTTARTAAQILADYNPSANIIASYSFSNNVGDSSGNNLHGTIIGSPTFVADRNGISNKAIAFNGNASNRVEVNDTSLLHPASLSVAAWFKYNALGGIQTISHKTLGTGVADSWTLGTLNSSFSSWLFDNSSGATFNQVASDIVSNQWYYGVSTFDNVSKQHKLYIDGILRSTNTFNSSIGYDNSKMLIGAGIENNGPAFSMNGAVDELKIYNGALTPQQILNEYVTQTNFNTKGSGNAISFDGNDDYVQTPISLLNGATQFTMDFWVKTTENRTNGTFWQRPTLIGNANPSGPDGDFGIITNGGQIGVWSGTCSCGDQLLQTTTPINDNKWHHIAVTNNNVIMQIYVDGILLSGSIPSTGSGGIVTSARSLFIGASNSCCSGINAHAGTIDEVRFWNVALTETQVRERMCRKIKNDDALYSNLKAYYNFDENTGTTAFDGSINNQLVPLVNTPTRITSGAPIGNSSSFSYAGASSSLNHANPILGDDVTATLTAGAADGIHVYHVNEAPNSVAGVEGLENIGTYFGTFVVGGTSPQYSFTYNYDGIPNITNENTLVLGTRANNSVNTWAGITASLNTTANTLSATAIANSQAEFRIAALDAGLVTSSQANCFAYTPSPLTATPAFNNNPSTTYQWQDSSIGGMWQNISGATTMGSLTLSFANSTKFYRRLATLSGQTISSNIVTIEAYVGPHPATYPINIWNFYAYDGVSVDSTNINFRGSYSLNSLNFNTQNEFSTNSNPSTTVSYSGCAMTALGNAWTLHAKRQGFPTGSYTLVVNQHDDLVKIFKDGIEMISGSCCNNLGSTIVSLGTLNASSKIECRVANVGGPGHLQITLQQQNLVAGTIGNSQVICGIGVPTLLNQLQAAYGGATTTFSYQWQDSTIGGTWQNKSGATNLNYQPSGISQTTWYRRLASNGSETQASNEVQVSIQTIVGNPSDFGNNQWNVYAYNGTDLNLGGGNVYRGFYTNTNLNINTNNDWNSSLSPSSAANYQGCSVDVDNFTWAMKRQGFPTGNYFIDMPVMDNDFKILVNGTQVFQHTGSCCGPYNGVTLGVLDASSTVEIRVNDLGSPGEARVNFISDLQAGVIGSDQVFCNNTTVPNLFNSVVDAYGGLTTISYQWQDSIVGSVWNDINAANFISFLAPIVTQDIYYRRKASNASQTVFSNQLFMDFQGQTFFADLDGDGFGDPNNTVTACTQPMGYLTDNSDCDDTDSVEHPGQEWYIDMDNDGYVSSNGNGVPALTITQCTHPIGGKRFYELVSTVGRDCNDNDASINPTAQYLTISTSPDFSNAVFPLQGDPSTTFFFEAIYFDANNALPSVTFPRAYLDFESNFIINESQDRIVVLSEFDAADQNTIDGKKYVGSISGLPNGSTWQTFMVSEFSNSCQQYIGPFQHPDVLLQPNVQIFANNIVFSDNNPPVSSPITVTASVGNPSDFAMQNVVVHMKNQADTNAVYPDIIIPYIASHTSGMATWNITTPTFIGLCPIQITVDYTNTITEPNELDNVAVASFNNGNAPVIGDIIVEAVVSPSTSYASANNTLYLDFNAEFNGTSLPAGLKVAGALVTFQIVETGTTFTGFTGANGNINIPFTAPVGIGTYHISGTVSSPPFVGNINPNITTFELINGNAPDFIVTLGNVPLGLLEGQSTVKSIVVTNNGLAHLQIAFN